MECAVQHKTKSKNHNVVVSGSSSYSGEYNREKGRSQGPHPQPTRDMSGADPIDGDTDQDVADSVTDASGVAESDLHPDHKRRATGHIKWDEETIAQHDLLRGTRQKIDEPDTPYHYLSEGSDTDSVASSRRLSGVATAFMSKETAEEAVVSIMSEVHSRLPTETALSEERSMRWGDGSPEGEVAPGTGGFKQKRAAHYNEFQKLKEWRKSHSEDEEEENGVTETKECK
jgi:protein phosphatase inhibitor 2